ncbi:2-keto-4-pentenoate hydratase/2-oxohepta-3-ene-1,7-dioic acid hydratase [Burkholderia sp. Ch1-1]|uniref:2-keto-4-pentenoate hydratase/2-oxohepta-3-ene-1,7-dioic acid hydratase (Catechol pathway) n=1 Tax=Paraburkholderia dioscoreae TaxID=2604047 RepID=A0A5Q4YY30_9BURK|nr:MULTISPECIES: fumarylacetoacetate hydrolase family protein [Paraburkholderia]EIF34336.1 2-keto-4-pentenoate hydratase/2-oxohepta-3-ene-1,7-dioic acid hydratase [Burkholderia sp. Ch1-1]MDR8395203.1 fumarylacetoacetate hydrolase family protein [Paraburkholderia sp. USG1]VVD33272.1 2-keto-4-pentenoate hydratase/2-oxohepta-3-ene-1,7-dioic acid hydratase (catechol pathway) [Paraburkholderia dioscoreae]
MKLVSFEHRGERRIGVLTGDAWVVDVTGAVGSYDMNVLIERYESLRDALAREVEAGAERVPLSDVTLLAPIPDVRRNIFCVGKNYYDHAHEFANSGFDSSAALGAVPPAPIIFSKPPTSVVGPAAAIDSSLDPMQSVDYEAELAVVIGKAGRCAQTDDPWSFVFGYTLLNDVTSRGLQKHHSQWLLGKGIDTFCPMGPAIVTADAAGDVNAFEIRCEVNGEVRQKAPLSALIFDIPTLIRTIGRSISFVPGDVIATGTPAGVGLGFNPPRYLKPGDSVRISVAQIGALENHVA